MSSAWPFLLLYIALFATNQVQIGVVRGAGLQGPASILTLIGYWVFSLPIAGVLAFKAEMEISGLWLGMNIGILFICIAIGILIFRLDWDRLIEEVRERTGKDSKKM